MIAKLLDFLDGIYPSVNSRSPFVGQNLLRRVILSGIYHTNNFLCWYYHNIKKKSISSPEEADYVVSLTTYPARVGNVWRVIEMAANQRGIKEKYAICLYLIKSEFEGIDLPAKIKELQARGLTVKFNEENLKCHNKYFYAFKDYPEKTIITIDDDLQYNHHSISGLIKKNKEYPDCIIYNRGNRILKNEPYNNWPFVENLTCPQHDVFPTGVGGVLYPPHCCNRFVTDMEVIKKTCLRADDLWLNFMSRLNHTKVVQTGLKSTYMVLPDTSQQTALWLVNNDVVQVGNDVQINEITKWSLKELNCDYFVNV